MNRRRLRQVLHAQVAYIDYPATRLEKQLEQIRRLSQALDLDRLRSSKSS